MGRYRCEMNSPEGFVCRLAQGLVPFGAWFYVTGTVPERYRGNPAELDQRLMSKYRVGVSRWTRYRRHEQGLANVHYARFEDFWTLIATKGRWQDSEVAFHEENQVKDIRRTPLRFWGHTISYAYCTVRCKGEVAVRIQREEFLGLRAYFKAQVWRRSPGEILWEFDHLPYLPYAGVKRQYRSILDSINVLRKAHRLERIPYRFVDELKVPPVRVYQEAA